MDNVPEQDPPAKPTIRVTTDVAAALEALEKIRVGLVFSMHVDLLALDDELDILYRGQL
ncbi:hypothetical protein ACIP9H_34070 [Streptomyces sp. NPDC088732]|uniref:hypothetical protein n=1 Tax=Streptomyces sp. NPDC088732 TaxID=3365879 RepID=UPI0037F4FB4F